MALKELFLIFVSVCVTLGDDGGALSYTESDFDDNIAGLPHFVKFFAPWCGHCKRMAPAWDELGKKYNTDDDQQVVIAKVDCTVETALCSKQGVKGYPTVKWFKGSDEGEKYQGPRDVAELSAFVDKNLGLGAVEEDSEQEASAPEKVDEVWTLKDDSFKSHVQSGHHFIKFFAPWCGHCKAMAATWIEVAKEVHASDDAKTSIAEVDCTANKDTCSEHGVRGYPTIMWFTDGKMIEKYSGARDKKSFMDYVKKMEAGKPGSDSEEEKVPEKKAEEPAAAEGAAVVLTTDSFEDAIKAGTTFVKFYAPWCGHCKRLAPTWDELSGVYASDDSVQIAKVDCTVEKDLCKKFEVRGYPTLKLFKDGGEPEAYSGARTLDALKSFVKSNVPRDEL